MAFEEACVLLRDCLEIEPDNWQIRHLLDKCELGKKQYDNESQRIVTPSQFTAPRRTAGNNQLPVIVEGTLAGVNIGK